LESNQREPRGEEEETRRPRVKGEGIRVAAREDHLTELGIVGVVETIV
jgi:hypothetical protein